MRHGEGRRGDTGTVKRSTTKKRIRHAEKRMASEVADCLAGWLLANNDWREGALENLGMWLTYLLSFHVQLDLSWPRDRWLDWIEGVSISIQGESVLHVKGQLWWGLVSNIGGALTAEPFQGVIRMTGLKRHPMIYAFGFGTGAERRQFSRGCL